MTVGWGIIGIGRHSDRWMAPAFKSTKEARLVAVYSRDQGRADAFSEKHGAGAAYSDLDALLANPEVDAVYIGSPNAVHTEQALAAIAAGKHVLVDKPMAVTVEDAQQIVDAAKKAGVMLSTGYNNRYQPLHRIVRELIQSGEFGAPVFARADCFNAGNPSYQAWRYNQATGGGSMMSIGCHAVDLMEWVLGREIIEVSSLDDSAVYGVDRLAAATLRMDGDVFGQVMSALRVPFPQNGITVHCERGYFKTHSSIHFLVNGRLEVVTANSTRDYEFKSPSPQHSIFVYELDELSQKIQEGSAPVSTGEDGVQGMRVLTAIVQSGQEHRAVSLRD